MNDQASQTHRRLWYLSGVLFAGATVGAGLLLAGYGKPSTRHGQHAASAPSVAVAPARRDATPPSATVTPIAVSSAARPIAAGATIDAQAYLDQRFPYQVIAEVKPFDQAEYERNVRAAFPDFAKVMDDSAKNPPPVIAAQVPAVQNQYAPTDSER